MSDYRAAIERDGCKHSCNTSKICVCAMIEDADDEIARLREALRVIADGDAPRDHAIIYRSDGVHSKHDKCRHGAWMYDGCEDCVIEYARAALGEGK